MTKNGPGWNIATAGTAPPFVRAVIHRAVVDSTSNLAREMLLAGFDELPLLVRADRQTRGRGRGENAWWSDEGSLTFTLALDPAAHGLRTDHEPRLALLTALAVIEAVRALGLSVPGIGIRWPNDIQVEGRKLGGILPERIQTTGGPRVLIGLGLNVLTRMAEAPAEVRVMATSLADLQTQPLEPDILHTLLAEILAQLEHELPRLAADDSTLAERWDQLNLLRGETIRVALGPAVFTASALQIDAQGALWIHDGQQVRQLFGGQVLRGPQEGR